MKYTGKHNGHNGDVQFFSIDILPEQANRVNNQPIALGETHNHAHIATGDCKLYNDGEFFYVKTGVGKSFVQHTFESLLTQETYQKKEAVEIADHLPKELLPNTIYKVGIHKKYDPFQKIWEKVTD